MVSKSYRLTLPIIFFVLTLVALSCATESTPEYILTASVEPVEAGSVSQSSESNIEGEAIHVTASPNQHWAFSHWGGDLLDVEDPILFVHMDSDKHVVAVFEKKEYPLTVHIEGEGEVVKELIQDKTTEFKHESVVRLKAIPEHGWEFVEWNGAVSESEPEVEIEIQGEIELTAIFKPIDYEITIEVAGEGRVDVEEVAAKSSMDIPFGTILQLSAVPSNDWKFYEWSGDLDGSELVEVVEVTGAMTVLAKFITTPSVVTSTTITELTENTARISAEVVANGGVDVTERGFCWSTSQNPTTNGNCTSIGSGLGSYAATLTGLSESTEYFVRGYAVNAAGTAYGNQVSFETISPIRLATVQTSNITSITSNSAISGGVVNNNGGANVTQRGVCWSRSQNPTTSDNCTNDGSGLGSFSSVITGLNEGRRYYVRSYAINSQGTAYGNQREFETEITGLSGETVTDASGNVYPVVRIGNQRWMASNLRTTRYRDGTIIRNQTNPGRWATITHGVWAYYNNNAARNGTYGKLYNWYAATDSRGICPAGWRVPSDQDFKVLEAALGMPAGELNLIGHRGAAQNIGGKMKVKGNSLWRVPISDTSNKYFNPNFIAATNSSGFSGVPSGNLNSLDATHSGPGFYSLVRDKDLWTSTSSGGEALIRALSFNQSSVYRERRSKQFGLAIRCVR